MKRAASHTRSTWAAFRKVQLAGTALTILFSIHADSARAQPRADVPSRFRESVSLATDSTVRKILTTAEEYLATSQWDQAFELLNQLDEEQNKKVVFVANGQYVGVSRYRQSLLTLLPAEGRAAYRSRVDAQARALYESVATPQDTAPLKQIVQRFFHSSFGDDALWQLGERAWENGDVDQARVYWEHLIPPPANLNQQLPALDLRYVDADFSQHEIMARLVLCSIALNETMRAKKELARFQEIFPDATGSLAGRQGRLAEILNDMLSQRQDSQTPRDANSPLYAPISTRPTFGAAQWQINLPQTMWNSLRRPIRVRPAFPPQHLPNCFPAFDSGSIFLNTDNKILAYDIKTGRPTWPIPGEDNDHAATIYPSVPEIGIDLPIQPTIGVPQHTTTIADGRLYARMGSPVTGRARRELRPFPSEIVCLNIRERQGELMWKTEAIELSTNQSDWSFEGSPTVAGNRVYVPLREKHPQTKLSIGCLDAESGRPLWIQPICAATESMVGEERNLASHQLLTSADDALFYATNAGAVAAIEQLTGAPRWIATYEREWPIEDEARFDPYNFSLTPCLYDSGIVIAAPRDSQHVMAIDSRSGSRLWSHDLRDQILQLIGVIEGTAIVSGDGLWGLDLYSGQVVWHVGFADPAFAGFGRGLLVENSIYWPLRHEIIVVRATDGRLIQRIPLKTRWGQMGGNLAYVADRWIVTQPDRVVAFSAE